MPSTRRNRGNGPVTRLLSPVQATVNLTTRTGSRILGTTNSVWRSLGNGASKIFGNATHTVNAAGRRLITGKRGGSRRSRSRKHTRKHGRKHGRK